MPTENNKRTLGGLEALLKTYNTEDDYKSGWVNFKEALKKSGVVIINSARAVIDIVGVGIHAIIGGAHAVKVVVYDIPSYVLSPDEISSEKAWQTLKEDVNASKSCAADAYQDVGHIASDVVDVVENGGRSLYHAGKATSTAVVFAFDVAKATKSSAGNAIDKLHSKVVGPRN